MPRGLIFFTCLTALIALLLAWEVQILRETIDLQQETIEIHKNNSAMCMRALRTTSDFLASLSD